MVGLSYIYAHVFPFLRSFFNIFFTPLLNCRWLYVGNAFNVRLFLIIYFTIFLFFFQIKPLTFPSHSLYFHICYSNNPLSRLGQPSLHSLGKKYFHLFVWQGKPQWIIFSGTLMWLAKRKKTICLFLNIKLFSFNFFFVRFHQIKIR